MSDAPGQKPTICNEIVDLVSELCHDPQSVFKERHNDQESAKGGQISTHRLDLWLLRV